MKPIKDKSYLAKQCYCTTLGDVKPEDMGTSGLISYVLIGIGNGKNRWARVKHAHKIVKARGLDTVLLFNGVYATAKMYGINTDRMQSAVSKFTPNNL